MSMKDKTEFGWTEEDQERARRFSEMEGRGAEILQRGDDYWRDKLCRDKSYLVNVLIAEGHFPRFLADELDVDIEVVEYHYENEPYDYDDASVMTLSECHQLHQAYEGEHIPTFAEEHDVHKDVAKYHLDGECQHDQRVLESEVRL